jgi:cell wall-associated NlpC family hydrolase
MRKARALAALVGLAATVITTSAVPHAKADPLGDARARAATLTKTVNRLQDQAEVAIERYDAAQAQLSDAISQQVSADQQLSSIQASAAAAQQSVIDRTRALYESGGNSAMVASLFNGGDPTEALDRYTLADSVIAYSSRVAEAAANTLAQADALDRQDAAVAHRVVALQTARQNAAAKVQTLLSTQRRALRTANATVRQIMRANERAAAAAAAADFTSAVTAAGGSINPNGPITPPNSIAAAAIAAAHSRIGLPYVWGATGPNSFDCSGLTQWAYAHAGITLPRVAADQYNSGPHPSLSNLEPGDLLFWATDTSNPATIHHVTMYIGRGLMIAAPHTGENVQIQPVYMTGFIGATRPWVRQG